ncbi:MAG TPA: sulfotransferase [Chthonomonadaceae bacterium]|nr:sulfotransferase [Chthonomonadaceae bacterium]
MPLPAAHNRLLISAPFRVLPPPLIIVGMHRSGTSLVAGMLTILGVYLDPAMMPPAEGERLSIPDEQLRQDGYGEAQDFRLLNERLLARASASWDYVEPFLQRRDRPTFARLSLARMQLATFGSLRSSFLRPLPPDYRGPWGWKDPRTSLTLPYWLRLFPEARILHVRRNPENVVNSLQRRAHAWAETSLAPPSFGARLQRALLHPDVALHYLGRRLGLVSSAASARPSLLDRDYCLRLCQQYVEECARFRAYGDRYLEVQFEEIIQDPATLAANLAQFAGITPSSTRMQQAIDFVCRKP